jgi:DNA-binding NarL/FixJ family response regulator
MTNIESEVIKSTEAIRLLLVDIHALSRTSSRQLLDSFPELNVVGETSDFLEAMALLDDLKPDIVLISMRVQGATEVARAILKRRPSTKVVVLTLFDDPEYVRSAMEAGAHAYVLKQEPAARILEAIDRVLRGEIYLSPGLGQQT